jgi:hypothetical protein
MIGKDVLMKCGHLADCVMDDVPYHDMKISIATCSLCFDQFGTAMQSACIISTEQEQVKNVAQHNELKFIQKCGVGLILISVIIIATILLVRI